MDLIERDAALLTFDRQLAATRLGCGHLLLVSGEETDTVDKGETWRRPARSGKLQGLLADPELEFLMQRSPRNSHRIAALALALAATAGSALAEGPAAQPAVVAAPPAIAAAPAETHKERAIFAVSDADPQKWNLTLGNISNAIEGLGAGSADIELVVYGPGIAMLKKDSAVAARLAEAIKAGVRVAACQNSMRGFHLEASDLVPGTTPVPSGVVELIRREHSGYAYVRS